MLAPLGAKVSGTDLEDHRQAHLQQRGEGTLVASEGRRAVPKRRAVEQNTSLLQLLAMLDLRARVRERRASTLGRNTAFRRLKRLAEPASCLQQ